jgi:hypothetical protein
MTSDRRGLLGSIVEEAKAVAEDARDSVADARATVATPPPGPQAPVMDKIAYVEQARLTVARLEAPDGAGDTRTRGIAEPLLALCRSTVDAHPDLVDAVLEPLLAQRRKLGDG